MFSASQLEPGDDLRPGHHALHLGLDYLPAAGQRLSAAGKAAEGGRERAEEDQRIHPLRHGRALSGPKLVLRAVLAGAATASDPISSSTIRPTRQRIDLRLATDRRADDDRRHGLPDVARRADRRIRHRQRHQPVDHGRHSRPHAARRSATLSADLEQAAWSWAASRGKIGVETLLVLGRAVRRRGARRGADHARASAASPRKAPSTSAAAGSTAARGSTCRCGSTRPA